MKSAVLAFSALVLTFLTSCAYPPSPPGPGSILTDVQGPLAVNPGEIGTEMGTAKSQSILGLISMGDSSINAAASSVGITEITHVDFKSWSILGIIGEFTTVVYGNK
ncbi:MAG: TRL-like family protein [Planctomycetota bacterium]